MKVRNSFIAAAALGVAAVVTLSTLAGCGSSAGGNTKDTLSGRVTVSGSTTVLPIASEASTQFMDAHPGVTVDVQGGGSSVGITQVGQSAVDIGTSSRELKPEEQSLGLVSTKIAYDVIAVIVNPGVNVPSLTKDQVKGIFTGTITSWQQVGGSSAPISVVVRDKASGTREMFDQKALDSASNIVTSAIECNSNGILRDTVASTQNAIGYVSLGYMTSAVKAVQFNGVNATKANALSGSYPLARYLFMLTKGEAQGVAKAYIDFVTSAKFQNDVVSKEYIPLTQL